MRSDEVLIPPAWVQIAAILARADEAECSVIRDIADVSDASLSKHLSGKQWRIDGISRFMSNGDHSANDPIAVIGHPHELARRAPAKLPLKPFQQRNHVSAFDVA